MSAALVAFVGALVGLMVGSGITFWSTRRTELAAAAVATSVLAEELRRLRAECDARAPCDGARVQTAWDAHRNALIGHLRPDDFRALAGSIPRDMGPQKHRQTS